MKNVLFSALLIAIVMLSACKKDDGDDEITVTPTTPQYFPLTVGSYWVYEIFKGDTLGHYVSTGKFDTVFVAKDTLINGQTYALFKGTRYGVGPIINLNAYRVQGDFIINSNNRYLLSWADFTNTIDKDSLIHPDGTMVFRYEAKMQSGLKSVQVPAGNFQALERVTQIHYTIPGMPHPLRDYSKFFVEDVGMVIDEYGYSGTWFITYQKRLVRYHIQ